ncbi:MAG: MFS transporter [Gemmatimonadota bacterium]
MSDAPRRFRGEPPLLAYGISFALLSSLGQTFLISLFVPSFTDEFALSDGAFGGLYSAATLVSAMLLPWAGRRLDHVRLTRFSVAVVMLMAFSALTLAAAPNVAVLGIALVGLRLSGQGLSGHTAYTVMARYSGARRGRALSIASLGFPAGEALLPYLTAIALVAFGWRRTWVLFAAVAALVFTPALVVALRRAEIELDPRRLDDGPDNGPDAGPPGRGRALSAGSGDWTRAAVLKDRRLLYALPAALLPSFWLTGIFLYQTRIAASKGWSLPLMASAFVGFAASRVVFSLLAGRVVDRLSARTTYPFVLLPMAFALALPLAFDDRWVPYGLMTGLGMTMGFGEPVRSSLWAELYGVRHLGAIKAMIASFGVLAAAGSPVLIGLALDSGTAFDSILWAGLVTTLAGAGLATGLIRGSGAG